MDMIEFIVMQILGLSYEMVHGMCIVKDSRITRASKKDRTKHVDLIIGYGIHELILEMNNNYLGSLFRNIVYGMTRIVTFYQRYRKDMKQKKQKVDYYNEKIRVSVINLNWCHKNHKPKINKTRIDKVFGYDDEKKGIFFEVINVSLDNYAKMPYNEIDTNEKFYKLLTIDNKHDLLEFTKDESLLQGYVDKLIRYSKNEKYKEEIMTEAMDEYLRELDLYSAGEQDGIERGIKRGIKQNQCDVVLKMYKDNVPFNLISKYNNLSIEGINEIINSNKKR